MRKKLFSKTLAVGVSVALAATLGCVGLVGCSSSGSSDGQQQQQSQTPQTVTVTDMAGRTVEVPADVKSIATFGSVGVLNAFVEAMGEGDLIVNQMPANFTKNDNWAMQYKFAPQIADGPVLETADGVNIEKVMTIAPDLCITMTEETAQQLQENGQTCIVLKWGDLEDVKTAVTLMGQALGEEKRAQEYIDHFDKMVAKAEGLTAKIPADQRKDVIYGDITSLTNPHIISEWWITEAGGNSVTKDTHKKNSLEYTMEELLAWQPEVIFTSKSDIKSITDDAKYASLPAVQNGQIYIVPTVAHVWGNRTVEQPLTIMWAMNKMYPDVYPTSELSKDIKEFYKTFFEYDMSDDEVESIIYYKMK